MKKPIIIQYKNPESLFNGTIYYGGLVITAMQQMKTAYQKRKIKAQVQDANMILRILLPDWYNPLLGLRQFCILSDCITDLSIKHPEWPEMAAFKNNRNEILKSIKTLAEIGIEPDDIPSDTIEERLLKYLYQQMIENKDSGITAFHQEMNAWNDAETFKECLLKYRMKKAGSIIGIPKAVYFQGFYYITPLQLRLIRAFCQLDIPIYFLNAMDEDNIEDYEVWIRNPIFQHIGERRIPKYETSLPSTSVATFQICKFSDAFSMVCRLRSLDLQKTAIYAPMSTDVKELLETFFPNQNEKVHIFAYPVGQYLLSLYNMWDDENNGFRLDSEAVRNALATGWAGPLYADGTHLLMIYDKMQDYFQDCTTLEEWQHRLETLHMVVHDIMPYFQKPSGNLESERWRRIFSQPLHSIGAFDCTESEVQEVTQAIRQMMTDARFLFGKGNQIDLKIHFAAIKKLLQQKVKKQQITKEERKVLAHLKERLDWIQGQSQENALPIEHLSTAMTLFLGGNLDEEELNSSNEENQIGGVRGISDIESAQILHGDKQILLCCCDANNLPGCAKPYPWPLTHNIFETILTSQKLDIKIRRRCEAYMHVMETTRLGNRYLFHLARRIPGIEFSWIEHQENKDVNPSIYLAELAHKYHLTINSEKGVLLTTDGNETVIQPGPWSLADTLTAPESDSEGNTIKEWNFDEKFCPDKYWRWLYDYVLQDHPTFTERFQLSFLITSLIAIVADIMPCKKAKAASEVFSIYPAFSSSEQQERIDFVGQTRQMGRSQYDGYEYTLKRLYLEYPLIKIVNQMMMEDPSKCKELCYLCPEKNICFIKRKVDINE